MSKSRKKLKCNIYIQYNQIGQMRIQGLVFLSLLFSSSLCSFTCSSCETAIKAAASTLSFLIPDFVAIQGLEILCMRKYDSKKLCKRVGEQIAPLAISNFIENHINPDKRCSFFCNSSFVHYNPQNEVERILNGATLREINLSSYIQEEQLQIKDKKILNILHLSDIHQDKNYTEKSSINCEYPICCHEQNGFPENPSAQAQPFGSKNCDSPPKLFDSFLNFIKNEEQIDIIIATGDFSAHNEWEKTSQSIIQTENEIQEKVQKTFPSSIFIKAEGNNDYIPDHQYDPKKNPILIKVTNVKVGLTTLTFVALNTIAFDDFNLYLLGDQSYAIFQLMLLQQMLQKYENVYLLGHIPPTLSGTAQEYAIVYRALIAKYSSRVKGQFYGHTHSDQLTVNTYPNIERATGYGFICPSLSPLYIGSARSRVYRLLSGSENGIVDYTQYILRDLSSKSPNWKQEYSFRQKYHLPQQEVPLTIEQIASIKDKIMNSKSEQIKYIRITGLNQQYGEKAYCHMIDDWKLRRKCFNKGESLTDKLFKILDILRGKWGYSKRLVG